MSQNQNVGTIGSIKFVRIFHNDTIVMNSDLFTDINYEDFYLHFKEYNAGIYLVKRSMLDLIPEGEFFMPLT